MDKKRIYGPSLLPELVRAWRINRVIRNALIDLWTIGRLDDTDRDFPNSVPDSSGDSD